MRYRCLLHQLSGVVAVIFSIALWLDLAHAEEKYPGRTWEIAGQPEAFGYSSQQLYRAKQYADGINTAAVIIVVDGVIIYEWGSVHTKMMTHSMRKSFLSALFGNYVHQGTIQLDKTINSLGINDNPSLSDVEKQATIHDLLKARSGIYHPALYETADMKSLKPERHSQIPGTHWYYNNWDFNVLGTIFKQETGKTIFEAIKTDIADPIGMEDYVPEDGWYITGKASRHAAYPFRITARDLARRPSDVAQRPLERRTGNPRYVGQGEHRLPFRCSTVQYRRLRIHVVGSQRPQPISPSAGRHTA